MCSSIRFRKQSSKIGDLVHVFALNTNREGKVVFAGFATEEKLNWWLRFGVPVHIKAHSFFEGKVEFEVPGGRIEAIGIKKEVRVNNRLIAPINSVKLVTRAPLHPFEVKVHKRWPLIYYPRDEINPYIWETDITQRKQFT